MDKILLFILLGVALLALIAVVSGILGGIFMLLWNWVIVGIFGAPVLSFWQAWGLWIIISMVGGSFRCATSSKD